MLGPSHHRLRRVATVTAKQSRRRVHLFALGTFVADRWTERDRPHSFYAVGRHVYDVQDFVRVTDPDGSPAFDVNVALRPTPLG